MKKILFTLLASILLSTNASSQITKGNWMYGGDATFRGYKFENSEKYTYYAEVFPKAGYFFADNFVAGSEIGVYINNATYYTSFVPFARYYILDSEKILNPFVEGGIGIELINYKNSDQSFNELMYQFKFGSSIFFTSSSALNITLNYKNNSFEFDQEISLAIGFQIHLEKK